MGGEIHGEESLQETGAVGAASEEKEVLTGTESAEAASDAGDTGGTADKGVDFAQMIAERDGQIAALQAQIAEAAKNAEAAEKLASEIENLKKKRFVPAKL